MSTTQTIKKEIVPMLQGRDVLWIQHLVRQVPTSQHMVDYAVDLARATRPKEPPSPDFVKNWLAWGAGPRAAQNMVLGAKARAILHGRFSVTSEDIRTLAYPVLRHRIFTNFNADAEGIDVEQVIEKILETIPEPSYGEAVAVTPRGKAPKPPSPEAPSPSPAGRPAAAPAARPAAAPQPAASATPPAPRPVPPAPPQQAPRPAAATPPPRPTPVQRPSGPTPPPAGPTPPPK
jgi:MoxR-like ATPase